MFLHLIMLVAAKSVVVSGNQRISKDVIASRIAPEAYENDEAYNDAYKGVVNTGFFKDVKFEKRCDNIAVQVTENSTINQVAFEGNKKLKDDQLTEVVKKFNIISRRPFSLNETHLAPVIQAIKEAYRQASVPVEVTISTMPLSDNRVNVIFNITEDPKMRIKSIKFQGLKSIPERALRGVMYTKKYNPIKFFTQDHYFLLERVEYDNRAILEYIKNNGYPNAKVTHTYAQIDPNTQNYRLTFFVEEGDKYKIGDVSFDAERKDLPMDKVKAKVQVKTGQLYSMARLRGSIIAIQEELSKRGFNTLDFDIAEKPNHDAKTIDITFKINKGRNITVRRIHIVGNTRTRQDVILDRIKLREGDRFNQIKLMESQRNLEGTGFFKEVNVQPAQVDEHTVDITVKVTEARTGAITFNLGYGTLQGVMASIGLSDSNIKGSGLTLQTGVSIAKKEQSVNFGISNPRFLRRDIRGGFNLMYSRTTLYEDRIEKTLGGDLSVAYDLSSWVRQDLSLGARYETSKPNEKSDPNFQGIKFEDISAVIDKAKGDKKEIDRLKNLFSWDEKSSIDLKDIMKYKIGRRDRISSLYERDFGDHGVTEISHGLTVRPPIFPVGFPGSFSLRMDNALAGLVGDISFMKNTFTASYQHRLGEYLQFVSQFTYGRVSKIGDKNLRITDCKTMGGQDFHGFDFSGIGPRDTTTGSNVGGKEFYLGKLEVNVPLPLVSEDLGVRLGAYTEFGSSHNSKFGTSKDEGFIDMQQKDGSFKPVKNKIYDENFCRVSIGMYVKLITPFGPLRFDFAKPVRMLKDKDGKVLDEERRFMVGYAYQL